MKFLLHLLLIISMSIIAFSAEVLIQDSVETGATYKNDVYYSFKNPSNSVANLGKEWDIAFEIIGAGYSVRSNGGWGVQVYYHEDMTNENFDDVINLDDVKNNWTQLFNSTKTWTIGAFNSNADPNNEFDLGWGEYSMATHSVFATSFYVVKTINGSWKKVIIEDLTERVYHFKIANLDGTELIEKALKKDDFLNKNFAYYSIDNDKFMDREPLVSDWDIVFGKYINMEGDNKDTPYPVTGIRTNPKILSVRVESDNPQTENVPNVELFDGNITNIGSDWKKFDGTQYVLNNSLVFFLYREKTDVIYRLIFTGFGGSSAGKYYFLRSDISTSVSNNDADNKFVLSLYPSVVSQGENINLLTTIEQNTNSIIEIFSSNGNLVWKSDFTATQDFSNINIPTNNLASGLYIVSLRNNSGRAYQKLIVQ